MSSKTFLFQHEIKFLKSGKLATSCSYFPRLIAHARDDNSEFLGVVYDLQPSNTLCHFVDKGLEPCPDQLFHVGSKAMDITEPDAHLDRVNFGSWGYIDYASCGTGLSREYSDVFAFGVILCELLFKCKVEEHPVTGWGSYITMLMNSIPWTLCWEYRSLTRV
ncbi:OLC1v1016256C1 [Oldenlandia corymbosa var. corymbosa]|uniref:OLC1v1016256C1 n=1 Tax=Oldenlandia corymbosa var. corymbosa TaxID=529605 RepID=A0AAV1E6N6_OLDCO|nr:OLC1v1016256C1 [Oldenlandia corymbosa var. corymbosa]